ncbi:MAG: GNAT family N-acetyltransferase, partial [Sediminispirochaetaceae bacterium]
VDSASDKRIGAVWLRYFDSARRGYGYIGNDIPEMSIAVVPEKRGMGVGTALIDTLLQYAAGRIRTISLSVDPGNPAVRLYKRFGFVECGTSGDSIIMRRDI